MMYSEKIVVAIKVGGRVLRESGDTVTLPFGCEYSILVKNLNSVRAQVGLSVDGKNATEGTRLIIAPNSSVELERFISNGNLQAGNRFKFIERSADVENHRGVGEDDGLIRVESWREMVQEWPAISIKPPSLRNPFPPPRPDSMRPAGYWRPGQPRMRSAGPMSSKAGTARPTADSRTRKAAVTSDVGITVPGSHSSQQFHSASGFMLEPQSSVIVLRLRGEVAGQAVSSPVTVNAKPQCSTCGKANKAGSEFCAKCGTALVLI